MRVFPKMPLQPRMHTHTHTQACQKSEQAKVCVVQGANLALQIMGLWTITSPRKVSCNLENPKMCSAELRNDPSGPNMISCLGSSPTHALSQMPRAWHNRAQTCSSRANRFESAPTFVRSQTRHDPSQPKLEPDASVVETPPHLVEINPSSVESKSTLGRSCSVASGWVRTGVYSISS